MINKPVKIHRALISVSDKTGIVDLARTLHDRGIEIVSTGGTAKALDEGGIDVIPVERVTGYPSMMDGRVKTLHPAIHGGILARRWVPEDTQEIREHGIEEINLVIVNLYPFRETLAKGDATPDELVEQIDIGGPTMVRAAAKNCESVAVITDPGDYAELSSMVVEEGSTTLAFRMKMAAKAFAHTASYDGAIASWFSDLALKDGEVVHNKPAFPTRGFFDIVKKQDLRYGENPHQRAALYADTGGEGESLVEAEQLQGKELSYNNLMDMEGAWQLAGDFRDSGPFCAIIKHANPCGAALGDTAREAYSRALDVDPVSAFGGIIAFNCPVDGEAAADIAKLFAECLIAPEYSDEALQILGKKKNLRVMRAPVRTRPRHFDLRKVSGGLLLADYDHEFTPRNEWNVATERQPDEAEMRALDFAWRCCKHVKSNAIVYATDGALLGVGAGQMSRVDSAKIAAGRFNKDEADKPIVMASDAFFPFRDGLDAGAEAGATAVIQPGGSKRDQEVIDAANEHGIAMVFTGRRHFRH